MLETKRIDGDCWRKRASIKEWPAIRRLNLLVLPYLAVIWTLTTYAGDIAKPWTVCWITFWLIYSPVITWTEVFVIGGAFPFATICFVTLIVATPFWPPATGMLITIVVSTALGAVYRLWISIAAFVVVICGPWFWYHGRIGL